MTTSLTSRPVRILRIYCPVAAGTVAAMTRGEAATMERDPTLAAMLAIIRDDTPLGDFGLYRSVVELSPGCELFTPGPGARPTLGTANVDQASPTAILTIHIDADIPDERLAPILDRLLAAHPWEVPVIEMTRGEMLTRS